MSEEMNQCQLELHKGSKNNKVSFDSGKESKHMLALNACEENNFTLLAVPFDYALSIRAAVDELVSETS